MKRRLYTLLISFLLSFPAVLSVYASTPADSTKVTGNDIVQRAMKYIGVPYRSGRMNPKVGFDCSGFTGQWKFSGDKHKSLQVDTERTFHQRYPLVML